MLSEVACKELRIGDTFVSFTSLTLLGKFTLSSKSGGGGWGGEGWGEGGRMFGCKGGEIGVSETAVASTAASSKSWNVLGRKRIFGGAWSTTASGLLRSFRIKERVYWHRLKHFS